MQIEYEFKFGGKDVIVFSCSNCGNFPSPMDIRGHLALVCKCGKHVLGEHPDVHSKRSKYPDVVDIWNECNEDCE